VLGGSASLVDIAEGGYSDDLAVHPPEHPGIPRINTPCAAHRTPVFRDSDKHHTPAEIANLLDLMVVVLQRRAPGFKELTDRLYAFAGPESRLRHVPHDVARPIGRENIEVPVAAHDLEDAARKLDQVGGRGFFRHHAGSIQQVGGSVGVGRGAFAEPMVEERAEGRTQGGAPGIVRGVPLGTSIFLIAVGAILRYAVTATVSGIDITTVGLILMIVGIVGLVMSTLYMFAWSPRRGRVVRDRVIEREPEDPNRPH
jgi:hypothetical protein